ncbi:OmpH family outer membrane protein [Aurantibacillus circumpalustris]|uniref:OmpH family outer membrane protein n=1 Tax=Aurantibacillus circumpalustris TaxID=3036359 RepID=UPI00295B5717|nr:OmpH family outer membrane protein [Aurantibacillus circumpalustris]
MTKKFLVVALLLISFFYASSQPAAKFGYVDTDYILSEIPEYKAAQSELDKTSVMWQKEIDTRYAEVDKLYKAYQADAILLTEEMKKKRENEIINREKEVKDLQKQRFGVEGELFKKRQELVKPIQDKVYNAIKAVAEKSGLGFVMDKSGQVAILYANSKYDKSDDVLVYLGYKK